ncbi:MAG: trypsin-like peptidase domain-containing protein [Planctomycetes bacterium]|nr:trypsin-like peptidase domain-containing protein [Planctomycetota bacterium]
MISIQTLVLAAAMAAPGQTVLLDFYSDSCGPCRSMEPTVRRLASEGFEIRKVNVEQEPQLTRRFRVDLIPTFVMVAGGREIDRVVGPASYDRLQQMFATAGRGTEQLVAQPMSARSTVAQPPTTSAGDVPAPSGAAQNPQQRALYATVRLRVEDPAGNSFGTGTIIDSRNDEALVVTCGHLFRESSGQGRIEVDLFAPAARGPAPGKLLAYDLKNDVALVTIWPGFDVTPVDIATEGYQVRPGDPVFSIGCDRGADASIRVSQITALNKYQGPANFEVAGQPVIGRSGGGLFNAAGQLIGVCNLADPQDDEGIYAALSLVHDHLAANLPRGILQRNAPQVATVNPPAQNSRNPLGLPSMPRQMPGAPVESGGPLESVPDMGTVSRSDAVVQALQNAGNDAEIIFIVRRKSDGNSPGQLLTISNPSPDLLAYLADLHRNQREPSPTVLEAATSPPAVANAPDWHSGSDEGQVLRGQSTR